MRSRGARPFVDGTRFQTTALDCALTIWPTVIAMLGTRYLWLAIAIDRGVWTYRFRRHFALTGTFVNVRPLPLLRLVGAASVMAVVYVLLLMHAPFLSDEWHGKTLSVCTGTGVIDVSSAIVKITLSSGLLVDVN